MCADLAHRRRLRRLLVDNMFWRKRDCFTVSTILLSAYPFCNLVHIVPTFRRYCFADSVELVEMGSLLSIGQSFGNSNGVQMIGG